MSCPDGWRVPDLDLAMQATRIESPVMAWGAIGRTRPMPGTYYFYVDDFRMNGLWKSPDQLLGTGCKSIVEPNFTTFDWMEPEEALVTIYRKRVLSRYWQTKGVKTLVDLNVAPNYLDVALLGVPKGWRSYATRSHRLSQMDAIEAEHAVAVEHAGTEDILFAVFGGSRKTAAACKERGYVHCAEHIEIVRGRAKPYEGTFELKL